jgi:hypothetical protein
MSKNIESHRRGIAEIARKVNRGKKYLWLEKVKSTSPEINTRRLSLFIAIVTETSVLTLLLIAM